MRFSDISGNEDLKKVLAGMVCRDRIPHALMIYENDGGGAIPMVLAFLQHLNCHDRGELDSCGACPACNRMEKLLHADVKFIFPVTKGTKVTVEKPMSRDYMGLWRELLLTNPYFMESELNDALGIEGKSSLIALAEATAIRETLMTASVEGGYRAFVVYLPEKMNAETANRLLKSVEEPPEKTLFIFITHAPERVLTTISSRCVGLRLLPLSKEEVTEVLERRFGTEAGRASEVAAHCGGSVGRALAMLAEGADIAEEERLWSSMLEAVASKDMMTLTEIAEEMGSVSSREGAKALCRYASENLRKIFMIQQGLPQLASLTAREAELLGDLSKRLKKTFTRRAVSNLDRAQMLVGRNVNLKLVFSDLAVKLYMIQNGQ